MKLEYFNWQSIICQGKIAMLICSSLLFILRHCLPKQSDNGGGKLQRLIKSRMSEVLQNEYSKAYKITCQPQFSFHNIYYALANRICLMQKATGKDPILPGIYETPLFFRMTYQLSLFCKNHAFIIKRPQSNRRVLFLVVFIIFREILFLLFVYREAIG